MKIGFLYPGQGSQSVGMGNDLFEKYDCVKQLYKKVNEISGIDVYNLINGKEEVLNETKNTQISILTMSLGILEVLKQNNIIPEAEMGLSLGEYTALISSKMLSLEDGVKLVQKRGEYMQNLLPEGEWLMAAILGMEDDKVEEVCKKVTKGFVVPANFNTNGQVVISGDKDGVEEAAEIAKQEGARKVSVLKTAGPFHTNKLDMAAKEFRKEIDKVTFNKPETAVIKNLDGELYGENENINEILEKHIINSVKFSKGLQTMLDMGIDTFIEIGLGKTLSGFVKRMKAEKEVTILNINSVETVDKVIEFVKERKDENE